MTDAKLSSEFLELFPYAFLKKHHLLPIKETPDEVTMACAISTPLVARDEIQLLVKKNVTFVFQEESEILKDLQQLYSNLHGNASDMLLSIKSDQVEDAEEEDLLESTESIPAVRLLNLILKEAIEERASDIHFDPLVDALRIRYRIDGVLHDRHSPPVHLRSALITRVKVLAKMDIAEHRLPQDGRIKIQIAGQEVDMRVSTVPVIYGERVVLRILDKRNVILDIGGLHMPRDIETAFKESVSVPEGILLVTGPTGSGKTTTLYSVIQHLSGPFTNIMTIEDPPEYKLSGIAQIAVRPKIGLTFARGLRHLLRQDPDVIMVGEIRDHETAEIAIQAALTGHLVISTLHTNDAISAIPRLLDMGIEPYLLSATIIGVMAQRLVRTICPHCKECYAPNAEEKAFLLSHGYDPESILYHGLGCSRCFRSGYKGRQGLYEFFRPDTVIRSEIAMNRPYHTLREIADSKGFLPLLSHGVTTALSGDTTLSEVFRVTRRYD
ncbi:type II/IV secretion system family protein [Chlamydia ibidis]|uniref:Type II/IV secretion system family protein n=2 Tax=Chlamydia ibidis TaxID=1405396 RepID=S7KEV8_9CHLA|nr:GspE/PulE family protein [Chlamydia ibidis]EPP34706.1 type II/IV secretion system family protein [Chlamydia ibidis]EQM62267.1 bacteriophage N4 adsorption protein B [Chlamydia ibidis 10-1398/6]